MINDFYCIFVHTEMDLIAFWGPSNCVNTQPYLGYAILLHEVVKLRNSTSLFFNGSKGPDYKIHM